MPRKGRGRLATKTSAPGKSDGTLRDRVRKDSIRILQGLNEPTENLYEKARNFLDQF